MYILSIDILKTSKTYTVTYKVYYMQTGANGKFLPLGTDGVLKTENLTLLEAELKTSHRLFTKSTTEINTATPEISKNNP